MGVIYTAIHLVLTILVRQMLLKFSSEIYINPRDYSPLLVQTINIAKQEMDFICYEQQNEYFTYYSSARLSLLHNRTADMSSNTFQIGQLIIFLDCSNHVDHSYSSVFFFLRIKANYVYKFNAICMR